MGMFLTVCGVGCFAFAGYAAFAIVSDIQIGIVATSVIGGLVLIGLGQISEKLDR